MGRVAAVLTVISILLGASAAQGATPAMIVPGQMNVGATGGFTYTIPIAVPPGTAGMLPALSLDYSSQGGDGIVGLGWTLSGLPSIGRCPRAYAQDGVHGGVNYDSNDRFCMEGQRLVAIAGTYGADGTVYRTEIDGFSKIISYGTAGNGPAYFKVWTKAGQIMDFGNTADSRPLAVGKTTARAWAVDKISDTKGNYLSVTYTNDETNGQAYPVLISYTGNGSAGLAPYNSVQFTYAARGDVTPTYQAGSLQQTTVVLTHIKSFTGSNLVSDYQLSYRAGTSLLHSRLTSVTLCDAYSACLAPTTFGWQGGTGTLSPNPSTPNPPLVSSFISNMWGGDFNGDGLIDIIPWFTANTSPGYCGIYLGNASGAFTASGYKTNFKTWVYVDTDPPTWKYQTVNLCSAQQGQTPQPADFTGDGLSDFTITGNDATGASVNLFMLNTGNGTFTQPTATYSNTPIWQYGDFNGDGRADLLVSNTSSYFYLSHGDGTFTTQGPLSSLAGAFQTRIPVDFDGDGCTDVLVQGTGFTPIIKYSCNPAVSQVSVPNWIAGGYTITIGDFNGDGKADVLRTGGPNNSAPVLFLSTGTGFTQTTLTATDWNKFTIIAGDFNGDGKADLLLVADGLSGHYPVTTPHQLWLSTGNGFVQAGMIANSGNSNDNPISGQASIHAQIADWNNDGAQDIWIQKPSGDEEVLFSYTPELMTTVSNGIGSTTTVTYDRLNKNSPLYAKCPNNPGSYVCGDAYPTQALDGPLYVVSRIDASNGVGGNYSSTYAYGGAKADLSGRGFMGFSSMAVTDLQSSVVQSTTYRMDFPYTGLIAAQTKTHGAVTLSSVVNTYAGTQEGTGTDGVKYYFVSLTQSMASGNDLDGTALPATTTNYTYDGYGNALTINIAVSDGSSKSTTNTYSNDATNWFLGRLLTSSVQSIAGASDLTRRSAFAYDPNTGLLTQETVEPSDTSNLYLNTTYTYDAYGNKTSATTSTYNNAYGAARSTSMGFDSQGQFQTSATNALSQSETWAYDARFGEPALHTGPNGITTNWTYDNFGRPIQENRPDGTKSVTTYAYCSGVNGGSAVCPTSAAYAAAISPQSPSGVQNGPITITYYDALSRAIATDVQGFDGSWVRGSTIYDANGRVAQTSRPYFVSGGTAKWTVFAYDDLGRVTQATMPDGGVATNCYHGLATAATNNLGQTTATTKNAQGLNATVTTGTGALTGCSPASTTTTTSYAYDAEGDLLNVTDTSGNVTNNVYDLRGRKTDSYDPDMGHWAYAYDGFGELISQTDAKSQTTMLAYDLLGRLLQRSEPGLYSTWTYGTALAGHDVGKLIESKACASSACASVISDRTLQYDSLARPVTSLLTVGSVQSAYTTAYDTVTGKIASVTYPSGLVVAYVYNTYGYLCRLTDGATAPGCSGTGGTVFWTITARDAELHATAWTAGNGVTSTAAFDPDTGLPQSLAAQNAGGSTVASYGYSFDTIGNLTARSDNVESYSEHFCYDALNRLTDAAIGASCTASGDQHLSYDALGNITSKSDIGAYLYPASGPGSVRPHALSSITGVAGGLTNPQFSYDANGNLTCVSTGANCTGTAGRAVTLTAFNMAASITQGTSSITFTYDADHNRLSQTATVGGVTTTTAYLNDPVSGAMSEEVTTNGAPSYVDYLKAGGQIVAQRTLTLSAAAWGSANLGQFNWAGVSAGWDYFTLDHLGSVAVVTDASGNVVQHLSYDAWGRQRNANGSAAACGAITPPTARGFTNQEQVPGGCLVNLNARLYDAEIGRMMSPDPIVGSPYIAQELNRYSYVINNPLSLTDPSGLCFLGCFWKQSWFIDIVAVAAAIFVPEAIGGWSVFGAAAAGNLGAIATVALGGALAGAASAGLSGGNILKGFLFGGLTAGLTAGLGGALSSAIGSSVLGSPVIGRMLAYGFTGGLASSIQGGNFGAGFLAAGAGSLGGALGGGQFDPGKLIVSAALGGAASVLGGGKFENGAISAAFAYAATTNYGSSEDARVSGTAGETGDDARAGLSTFPGVSRCGNSLCGDVPYNCSGSTASCGLVIDKLVDYTRANSFDLTFSQASGWQEFKSFFFGGVLHIDFNGTAGEMAGNAMGQGIHLFGNYWQNQDPSIVAHEFSHDLGLIHNGAIGTLMYPVQYPYTPITLQPNERTNLLNAYGQ